MKSQVIDSKSEAPKVQTSHKSNVSNMSATEQDAVYSDKMKKERMWARLKKKK